MFMLLMAPEVPAGAPISPFEVNFGLFFWTWLVFGVLFFVLKKYAWPSLLKATVDREHAIQRQLDEAEKLNADARTSLAEQQKLLADTRASVHLLLAEAKSASEKERVVALEKTKQEQEELLARARREIQAERERAVAELRREAVDLSLAAASKLIGERFEGEADRKLVMNYIATLDKQN